MKEKVKNLFIRCPMIFFIVMLIIIWAIFVGYVANLWLPTDNPIEQRMEIIIRDETGLKFDFTPTQKPPMKLKDR